MMRSQYTKWYPLEKDTIGLRYDVDALCLKKGLVIILTPDPMGTKSPTGPKLKLYWPQFVCFQLAEESQRPDLWIGDTCHAWCFYTSKHSKYLDDMQADNVLFPTDATHHLLVGTNTIVDVISEMAPEIEIIQ